MNQDEAAALRDFVTRGLRRYFDEHPKATRENIGSITKRIVNLAIEEDDGNTERYTALVSGYLAEAVVLLRAGDKRLAVDEFLERMEVLSEGFIDIGAQEERQTR